MLYHGTSYVRPMCCRRACFDRGRRAVVLP